MTARLSKSASDATWRDLLAFLVGLLTAACASGGLIVFAPGAQVALLTALVVGMIGSSWGRSAISAAAVVALVALLGPFSAWWAAVPTVGQRLQSAVLWGVVAAATAAGVRTLAASRKVPPRAILAVAVALIVGNMVATTLEANTRSMYDPISRAQLPSFNQQLAGDVPSTIASSDDAWFFYIYRQVRKGENFYTAFHYALTHNPRWKPDSVIAYRLPTIFYLWTLLPNARWIVIAFLVLASAAVVCVVPINASDARLPLVLPACAALAAYFVSFPVQLPLFSQEAWAVTLGLGALAANAISFRSTAWRIWTVTAVVLGVLAFLVRETIIFVPLAGLVSVAVVRHEERRFRVTAWSIGLAVLVVSYALQFAATRNLVQRVEGFRQLGGGIRNVVAAIVYGTDMISQGAALPFVLVGLGILGAVLVKDVRMRIFVLLSGALPLAAFLVISNRAWYETSGQTINYWGATAVPILYALIPTAFTLLPTASVSRPNGQSRTSRRSGSGGASGTGTPRSGRRTR